MCQFVGDDVVDDMRRGLDQSPVEADFALRVAAAPAGFGAGEEQGWGGHAELGGEEFEAAGEVGAGLFGIPLGDLALHGRGVVRVGDGEVQAVAVEFRGAAAGILAQA